jgi:hypothetical protein
MRASELKTYRYLQPHIWAWDSSQVLAKVSVRSCWSPDTHTDVTCPKVLSTPYFIAGANTGPCTVYVYCRGLGIGIILDAACFENPSPATGIRRSWPKSQQQSFAAFHPGSKDPDHRDRIERSYRIFWRLGSVFHCERYLELAGGRREAETSGRNDGTTERPFVKPDDVRFWCNIEDGATAIWVLVFRRTGRQDRQWNHFREGKAEGGPRKTIVPISSGHPRCWSNGSRTSDWYQYIGGILESRSQSNSVARCAQSVEECYQAW